MMPSLPSLTGGAASGGNQTVGFGDAKGSSMIMVGKGSSLPVILGVAAIGLFLWIRAKK